MAWTTQPAITLSAFIRATRCAAAEGVHDVRLYSTDGSSAQLPEAVHVDVPVIQEKGNLAQPQRSGVRLALSEPE